MSGVLSLGITPLVGSFGAEISGLRLDLGFDRAITQNIFGLLSQYQFLLFRAQKLGPVQQVLLSRSFGTVETHRFHSGQLAEYPEIFRLSNSPGDGHRSIGHYWHSDGFVSSDPTHLFMLNVVEPPSMGGETLFVNAYDAWRLLTTDLREQIEKARWKHESGVWHPFHRQHFVTGRCSLLVNLGRIAEVDELTSPDVMSLVAELAAHLSERCSPYVHRWQEGDVILVDNWSVVHRVRPAPSSIRRVLHRSSVVRLHSFLTERGSL